MDIAQKFIRKSIKTIEIDGIPFTFRKMNPTDNFIMSKHRMRTREKLKKKKEECEDCPEDEPLILTPEQIQEMGNKDREIMLTQCVMEPLIVMKSLNEVSEGEVPYDLVDNKTAMELMDKIQSFSLELWEGVSLNSFPAQSDGEESDELSDVLEDTSEFNSDKLRPESITLSTDKGRLDLFKDDGTPIKSSGGNDEPAIVKDRGNGKKKKRKKRRNKEN